MVTPIRLYPSYCTLYLCTLTLTCWQLHALVALSSASGDISFQLLRCTLHWLQLNKRFSLSISLRNQQTFFLLFFLLEVGRSYHSTQFLNTFSLPVFPYFVLHSFRPWVDIQSSSNLSFKKSDCFNPNHHLSSFVCRIPTYNFIFCFI